MARSVRPNPNAFLPRARLLLRAAVALLPILVTAKVASPQSSLDSEAIPDLIPLVEPIWAFVPSEGRTWHLERYREHRRDPFPLAAIFLDSLSAFVTFDEAGRETGRISVEGTALDDVLTTSERYASFTGPHFRCGDAATLDRYDLEAERWESFPPERGSVVSNPNGREYLTRQDQRSRAEPSVLVRGDGTSIQLPITAKTCRFVGDFLLAVGFDPKSQQAVGVAQVAGSLRFDRYALDGTLVDRTDLGILGIPRDAIIARDGTMTAVVRAIDASNSWFVVRTSTRGSPVATKWDGARGTPHICAVGFGQVVVGTRLTTDSSTVVHRIHLLDGDSLEEVRSFDVPSSQEARLRTTTTLTPSATVAPPSAQVVMVDAELLSPGAILAALSYGGRDVDDLDRGVDVLVLDGSGAVRGKLLDPPGARGLGMRNRRTVYGVLDLHDFGHGLVGVSRLSEGLVLYDLTGLVEGALSPQGAAGANGGGAVSSPR